MEKARNWKLIKIIASEATEYVHHDVIVELIHLPLQPCKS